jgi:hypothetical protein
MDGKLRIKTKLKMNTTKWFRGLLKSLLIVLFIVPQLLYAQKIDCFVMKGPTRQLDGVSRIGILDFKGRGSTGQQLIDLMTNDLLEDRRGIKDLSGGFLGLGKQIEGVTYIKGGRTNIFTIIERSQIDRVLKEQRMSLSGAIDERTAARVGQLLGIDAIIIGEITWEQRKEHSTRDKITLELKTEKENCTENLVTSEASMKIINVETAEIIGTLALRERITDKKCGGDQDKVASGSDLLAANLRIVARKFADYFSPSYEVRQYELERIKVRNLRKQANEAGSFIDNKNIELALPLYYAIYQEDPYNPSAAYNLAVLMEIVGSFEEAAGYYEIAGQLDASNTVYSDGLKRAHNGLLLANYLESIGMPIEPFEFSTQGVDVFAQKIVIKGRSSDRVEVHELPDRKSKVRAKVPGGLEFTVIQQQGDWYKIILLNNQEGFVHRSNVN